MYNAHAMIEVLRDVEVSLIPAGTKVKLQTGTQVSVTQALGSSYTVYVNGNLVRVAGKDGDALGLVILAGEDINATSGSVEDKIWQQLKTCFDPEIPVNIVDLGLIYVAVTMTLTAAGCGMGPILVEEVQEKIRQIKDVTDVKVELVFDPPWDKGRMSDEAKLQLGLL